MPSRFEPCGLSQMYSQRYGTLPIVRATGGLVDTVQNYDERSGSGTGFVFQDLYPSSIANTMGWALSTYFDRPDHITAMRRQSMHLDYSWDRAAAEYEALYLEALPTPTRPSLPGIAARRRAMFPRARRSFEPDSHRGRGLARRRGADAGDAPLVEALPVAAALVARPQDRTAGLRAARRSGLPSARQPGRNTTYDLLVDGERTTVKLRADYLVSRRGRRFVAEVKSGPGGSPPRHTAATRRQLLEYWAVFQVDGILLVDGESRQVHEITFPTPNHGNGRERGLRLRGGPGRLAGLHHLDGLFEPDLFFRAGPRAPDGTFG